MPIKRPPLINGEIYHIVIRAIEGSKLFIDDRDYFRMICNLFEFNDDNPVSWQYRQHYENSSRSVQERKKRIMLVEILAFCLMPNHFHLVLRQLQEKGISSFMRKIGAGFGIYYNKKYQRSGHIFQGRYRAVHIKNDKQLITLFVYVHTNPAAIVVPNWKEKGINNPEKVIDFLEKYRWSSYLDYLQNKNFPSLTNREFLTEIMGGIEGCRKFVEDWIRFKKELADFDKIAIE